MCSIKVVDSIYLAYLVDVYPDPTIATWFRKHGAPLDKEQYALSQLIQWIWRSAIRDRNPIWLYIPSKRIRDMLTKWLGSPAA